MEREIKVEIRPTISELEEEIWKLDAEEQFLLLSELGFRAQHWTAEVGIQLASVKEYMESDSVNQKERDRVKFFLYMFKDHLEGDNESEKRRAES